MAASVDDLDIRSGGIVAVDTASLRAAGARLALVEASCDRIRDELVRAARLLGDAGVWRVLPVVDAAQAAHRASGIARDLRTMADAYKAAELEASAQVAAAAGNARVATILRARAASLLLGNAAAIGHLTGATVRWRREDAAALGEQLGGLGPLQFGPADTLATALTALVAALGRGTMSRRRPPWGLPARVSVTPVTAGTATAPARIAQLAERIPGGPGRVRVERYTMPGGSRRYVAYISGSVVGGPDDEAWDMRSNLELYRGSRSASYDAVRKALAASGAAPGDRVSLVGYSQGAMAASLIAATEEFDVSLLVTLGDPVQAEVGAGTLSVALRHHDDPVSGLAGGGHVGGVGAPGSFVASRETPGTLLTGQSVFAPHALDEYRTTAGLVDASGDPRLDGVHDRLAELDGAASVDVTIYAAARDPDPPPQAPLSASAEGAG